MEKPNNEEQTSYCWSCTQPVNADNALAGKYACVNNRCVRYGLVSSICIVKEKKPDTINKDATTAIAKTPEKAV